MNVSDYTRGNGGGRQPDFKIKVGLRGEKFHKQVGAAWKLKNGGLAIRLDPGIALVGAHDISITLWPAEEQRPEAWGD